MCLNLRWRIATSCLSAKIRRCQLPSSLWKARGSRTIDPIFSFLSWCVIYAAENMFITKFTIIFFNPSAVFIYGQLCISRWEPDGRGQAIQSRCLTQSRCPTCQSHPWLLPPCHLLHLSWRRLPVSTCTPQSAISPLLKPLTKTLPTPPRKIVHSQGMAITFPNDTLLI